MSKVAHTCGILNLGDPSSLGCVNASRHVIDCKEISHNNPTVNTNNVLTFFEKKRDLSSGIENKSHLISSLIKGFTIS